MRRARPARPVGWWRLRGDRIRANLDVRTDRCDRCRRPRARRRRRRRRRRSRAPPRRPAPRRRRRPSRPPRRWAPRAGSRPAPPARRSSSRETVCCGERSEGGSGGQRRARASVARGRRVDCLSARQNVRADRGFPRAAPGVFEGVRGRGNARLGLDAIDRGDPRAIARRSPRDSPERVPPAAASVCCQIDEKQKFDRARRSPHAPPTVEGAEKGAAVGFLSSDGAIREVRESPRRFAARAPRQCRAARNPRGCSGSSPPVSRTPATRCQVTLVSGRCLAFFGKFHDCLHVKHVDQL